MGTDQPENAKSCNRSALLKAAGIGMAAMGMLANSNSADAASLQQNTSDADVLVIGGGIAGVFAALKAKEAGANVILIDKGTVGRSGLSPFFGAYNYYNGAWSGFRSSWIKGKQKGGQYLVNLDYVEMFLDDSRDRYKEMVKYGATKGPRGHVAIWRQLLIDKGVTLIERTMVTELIENNGSVVGVAGFSLDEETSVIVTAKAVILASGSGALKTPGFPCNSITHDGDCMAYRIGAELSGKEFIDFHWTHWEDPANMYDNWKSVLGGDMQDGTSSTAGGGALDMAFSVNSGQIPLTMGGGGRGGGSFTPPGVRDSNLAIAGGSTAGMSPHKCEGIFPQNNKCESNIPGLYAAGDALCTGGASYHGVGTSSSSSAVQGARAGQYAAEFAKDAQNFTVSAAQKQEILTRTFGPRTSQKGFNPEWVTQVLQAIMVPYYVLYIKSGVRLNTALINVQYLRSKFEDYLIATNLHELRQAHELKNMLLNSEMKLRAALMRTESRGSHYREDYPHQDDENWLSWILISRDGDDMKLTKKAVPDEWKP
jgi:succinate dehydrogenase/fumarate reductase flavoprotein subunit